VCAFDAPLLIVAEGGTSTTFDARFDYTGTYQGTGHGLVAPVSTSGSVTQSASAFHQVDVPAGALHLRVRISAFASTGARRARARP
jgi:hypothetical protein